MKMNIRKILWAFLALGIVQSACGIPTTTNTTPTSSSQPPLTTPTYEAPPTGIYPPAFATYNEMAARLPQTFNGGGYNLPLDLSQVQLMDQVQLTDAQKSLLAQNGFGQRSGAGGLPRVLPDLLAKPLPGDTGFYHHRFGLPRLPPALRQDVT